jgi:DNA gyrase subunit A
VGKHLANVLSLKAEEKITSVIPVRRFDADRYLLMATRRGVVKKTALQDYSRPKAGGIIGIKLDEGDTLIGVCLTQEGDNVVLSTRKGMAICFDQADARAMGRNTHGVKGINLAGDDEMVGMVVADPEGYLLTVCENGYGKRTPFGPRTAEGEAAEAEAEEAAEEPAEETEEQPEQEGEAPRDRSAMRYRPQRRGGKGLRDIRAGVGERNGLVVAIAAVRDGDDIMLITSGGMVNRTHVDEIRITGRNTMGVRIMRPNDGDKIASLAKVAREDVAAQAETAAPAPEAPTEDDAAEGGEEAPGEE